MLADVVDLLACPHCQNGLELMDGRVVGCGQGHRFDVAKQGYLNLLGAGTGHRSDTVEMITARDRFLGAGHYRRLTEAIADRSAAALAGKNRAAVLDVGAGTGHHLAAVLDRGRGSRGIAQDLSVAAARRAARAHPRLGAVVADTWSGLPVREACLDLVSAIFAPRNPAEFARVLRRSGDLIVVTPASGHLAELRDRFDLLTVQEDKLDHLDASLAADFELQSRDRLVIGMLLGPDAVVDLVAMGPNAFHVDLDVTRDRAHAIGRLEVQAAVDLSWFRLSSRPPVGSGPASRRGAADRWRR